MSDFYVKGIDRKLNFIFFIAFATIGILALTAIILIATFGFMIYGMDLDKKLMAILSAAALFMGICSTVYLFRKSDYELGKFLQIVSLKKYRQISETLISILLLIAVIWLSHIIFKTK
ncbi:hypothetical protein [uncultured Campylobacter sp.]|uniref:hypothetical protein n=1 Tax=uncultured Campylobacter sp. TaxID=218934 RepID=UPI0026100282|nr:hypothetical protein [uncultured Campylobacter sp.]